MTWQTPRILALAVATTSWALGALLTAPASAQTAADNAPAPPPDPERFEPAGFPLLAGNSDIGFQFGGAGTLTRYHDALLPYLWNLDLILSTSVKSERGSLHFVQQSHVLRLDMPYLLGRRLRLDVRGSYERTVNDGYYGLGDNEQLPPLPPGSDSRHDQYLFEEARLRTIARVHTGTPFDIAFSNAFRYVTPGVYPNSKLAQDLAAGRSGTSPAILGTRATGLLKLGVGVMYDTRDSEFITHRGLFYQLGVAGTAGTSSENLRYGEVAAIFIHYVQLPSVFILAARVAASVQFGRVPFYDLAQAGIFEPQRWFGGESGVRGVPLGRYLGFVKAVGNLELRSAGRRLHVLGQSMRLGTTTFFDVGKLWNDRRYSPTGEGSVLGIKYGVGGGVFVQWGEAAIFRLEVAYSPDAKSENPSLPIGLYASDGLMF